MRNLTKEAESLVRSTQQPATPQMMFLAMLALLATAPGGRADNYWAYVPDPPLLQPASWSHSEIGVYTNCTWALGGFSSAHIRPVKEGNFTYQGLSEARPICFAQSGVDGCVRVNATTRKKTGYLPRQRAAYYLYQVSSSGSAVNVSSRPYETVQGNLSTWYVTVTGLDEPGRLVPAGKAPDGPFVSQTAVTILSNQYGCGAAQESGRFIISREGGS